MSATLYIQHSIIIIRAACRPYYYYLLAQASCLIDDNDDFDKKDHKSVNLSDVEDLAGII